MWVAASAASVTSVLASPLCRVRPPGERVPRAILGSAAGEVFGRLVRMTDGAAHGPMKRAVAATLAAADPLEVVEQSRGTAAILLAHSGDLARFAFELPAYVVASLLGWAEPRVADQTRALVAGFPASAAAEVAHGTTLRRRCWTWPARHLAEGSGGLLAALAREAREAGALDMDTVAAERDRLPFPDVRGDRRPDRQHARGLARAPTLRAAVHADAEALPGIVDETARSTRRSTTRAGWVAEAGCVAGHEMAAGEAILVVLAAANRDPAANPDPDRFDPRRQDARCFTFGAGAHACPGARLAAAIATGGVAQVLAGNDLGPLAGPIGYRPSGNVPHSPAA